MEANNVQAMREVLNRVHDYLGELIRDNLVEDTPRASDLADDVYDAIHGSHSTSEKSSAVGNAAARSEMPQEQSETMRENLMMTATVARKRLVEVATWLKLHPEIKCNDPYLTTHCLSVFIREAVEKLDFALVMFDSFIREGK